MEDYDYITPSGNHQRILHVNSDLNTRKQKASKYLTKFYILQERA